MTTKKPKAKQTWQQITITVEEEASLLVQQIFLENDALGLEIDDDQTRAIPEKPFTPTGMATITATFTQKPDLKNFIQKNLSQILGDYDAQWQTLEDGDWVNTFQNSWKSFTLGSNIWIVPSWEANEFKAPDESIVLYMDPGMAFGTGHHETTTLCARAISNHLKLAKNAEHMSVLDVGTGTGILAMIAGKMGAARVVGTDNDPEAIRVAIENCAHNGLARIEIYNQPPELMGPIFDLVVANILANPLIEMSTNIFRSMSPGATLFLSGILQTQEEAVREAYLSIGLTHLETHSLNEWVLIAFQKS